MDDWFSVNSKSGLSLLDPRTKIILICVICLVSMTGSIEGLKIYPRFMLVLLPFLLLVINQYKKTAWVYAVVLTISWLAESFLVSRLTGVSNLAVMVLSGIVTRFAPPLAMGYFFLKSTQVEGLIAAFQRMHVPMNFTIPFAVMFRFFPTIAEESSSITDAMKMRGITLKNVFTNPIKFMEYRFVPLMTSIVKIGDELSAAAITRGLGDTVKRTSISDIGFKWLDFMLIGFTAVCSVIYLIV